MGLCGDIVKSIHNKAEFFVINEPDKIFLGSDSPGMEILRCAQDDIGEPGRETVLTR
jgi:hypothetical protein